jgi:putative nucleotidyltransferase with HDIG domain
MSTDIFKQILRDHQELSSLPQTLAEVLRTVRDEKGSAQDLAAVLEKDPGMATKVLRAANSPYYCGGREITSVRQAVMTLGMRAVSTLALSTSIYDLSGRWQTSVDRVRFWRHSLEVALTARALAETVGYAYPDEVFVAGLLHDIGILVLERSFPDKFERIWRQVEAGDKMSDLEDDIWGTNHARVGQFLLEQWRIPASVSEVVGNHHNLALVETDDTELRPAQIVALANLLSRFTLVRSRPDTAIEIEQQDGLRRALGVTPDQIRQLLESMLTRVTEEAGFLEIEIGSPQEILLEANRLIYDHYCAAESLLRENRSMQ